MDPMQDYTALVRRLGADEPKLTGYEYIEEQDARRERMRQIHKETAVEPSIHPALNRKNCSLCLLTFPTDALVESATVKCLKEFSDKQGVTFEKFGLGVPDSSLLMQHRVPICAFCAQFFNPDAEGGLAVVKHRKRNMYEAFFDDCFPDTFSDPKIPEMDDKHIMMVKQKSMKFAQGKLASSAFAASEAMNNAAITRKKEEEAHMLRQESLVRLEQYNQSDESIYHEDGGSLSGSIGTGSLSSEDKKYAERPMRMTREMKGLDGEGEKRLIGSVRDPGGRKDASTGSSVYQFAVWREGQEFAAKLNPDLVNSHHLEQKSEDVSLTSSHHSLIRANEIHAKHQDDYEDHKDEVGHVGKDLW